MGNVVSIASSIGTAVLMLGCAGLCVVHNFERQKHKQGIQCLCCCCWVCNKDDEPQATPEELAALYAPRAGNTFQFALPPPGPNGFPGGYVAPAAGNPNGYYAPAAAAVTRATPHHACSNCESGSSIFTGVRIVSP